MMKTMPGKEDFYRVTSHCREDMGSRIFLLKKLLIKSDEEFCLQLGLTPDVLKKIQQGEILASYHLCQKISDVYGVRTLWLLTGEGSNIFNHKGKQEAPRISIYIDNMVHYNDPMFLQLLKVLNSRDLKDIMMIEALNNMFDEEEPFLQERRETYQKNHILTQIKKEEPIESKRH